MSQRNKLLNSLKHTTAIIFNIQRIKTLLYDIPIIDTDIGIPFFCYYTLPKYYKQSLLSNNFYYIKYFRLLYSIDLVFSFSKLRYNTQYSWYKFRLDFLHFTLSYPSTQQVIKLQKVIHFQTK